MSDQDIIIPSQDQIEVFVNNAGTISIAQRSSYGGSEDSIIAIQPCHINTLIAALRRTAKKVKKGGNEDPA